MTIDIQDLRDARPESVQRLARFVGVRVEGEDHAQLCWQVYRRINRRRP